MLHYFFPTFLNSCFWAILNLFYELMPKPRPQSIEHVFSTAQIDAEKNEIARE
jgi:hypothetical protein